MGKYVHGYSEKEAERLADQAGTLARLLHGDLRFPAGAKVLEAGCGIGSQTVFLAGNSPDARFFSIDVSRDSLTKAEEAVRSAGRRNVLFEQADIFDLPMADEAFDHIFVCFVLEHLADPAGALHCLKRVLKKGGSITLIEGDHGSFYCHPESPEARRNVDCLVQLQAMLGGDACIGRRLYPLLLEAGFIRPVVSPRMVYVDGSRPELVEGFSRNTFIAMVRGIREQAVARGLIDFDAWNRGIHALESAAGPDGTFCYTFFKALAIRA